MAASPTKRQLSVSASRHAKASQAPAAGDFNVANWAGSAVRDEALPLIKNLYKRSQEHENGWDFLGEPMSREEVTTHYPTRKGIFSSHEPWGKGALTAEDGDKVLFNFRAMHCHDENEDFKVELGECILTEGSGTFTIDDVPIKQLMRVVEIFMTPDGQRRIRGQWFYQQIDTAMACKEKNTGKLFMPISVGTNNERRLWLATVEDSETYDHIFSLDCIDKKVRVLHVPPSKCVKEVHPDYDPSTDYWYDQVHTRRCITNEDCYEDWSPFSEAYKALEAEEGLGAIRQLLQESSAGMIRGRNGGAAYRPQEKRELHTLDIFAGAGGLSFLADASDEFTKIITAYACDWNESACATFRVNHPNAHVFHDGLDQLVMLLKMWYKHEEAVADLQASDTLEEEEEEEEKGHGKVTGIVDVRLCENAPKHTDKAYKGQLMDALQEHQCWLEFKVQREGAAHSAWEKLTDALTGSSHMHTFVERTNAAKRIPHPGDIQLIAGGPPCQGVSGLNRHAKQENVLKDPRNRLVHVYLELVDLLQPNYILMEQVTDVFRKEDGMYARYTVCQLVRHGYQTRVGQCTAGNYGCAQGRRRVFFWGARSGLEQLPAFPAPTHRCKDFNTGVGSNSLQCHIDFQDAAQMAAAHPMVVMGDQLSDLPAVNNFSMSESLPYATEPTTLMQSWLRRPPPAGAPTLEERAQAADKCMQASAEQQLELIRMMNEQGDKALVGRGVFCRKDTTSKKNFATETWNAFLEKELGTAADGETALPSSSSGSSGGRDGKPGAFITLTHELERQAIAVALGGLMLKEREAALVAQGPLRDHRPMMCNADDYLRMVNVPHEKAANYRDLAGVVTNKDGTACGGHWHAVRKYTKATGVNSSHCAGGGMEPRPKASNNKTSRVDNYGATEAGAWRGTQLGECESRTAWLPTGDLLAPRWTITYKNGKSNGRHGCYGRIWYDEIQSTVVTRSEPHNLQILHPEQDRVLTVRENARCQGFPDYHVLVGMDGANKNSHGCGGVSVEQRYLQMGNAVAPPVALMLGHCLRLASQGQSPVAEPVIVIRDPAFEACMEEGRKKGLFAYAEKHPVAESDRGFCWKRHRPDMASKLAAEIIPDDDEEEPAPINDDDGDASDDDGARPSGSNGGAGSHKRKGSAATNAPKAKRAKAAGTQAGAADAAVGGQVKDTCKRGGAGAGKAGKAAAVLPPRAPAGTSKRPSRAAAEAANAAIWRSALTETQLLALEAAGGAAGAEGSAVAVATAVGGGAVAVAVAGAGRMRAKAEVVALDVTDDDVAGGMDQDGGDVVLGGQPGSSALAALCAYGVEEEEEEGGSEVVVGESSNDVSMADADVGGDGEEEGEGEEEEESDVAEGSDSPMLELDALVSEEQEDE